MNTFNKTILIGRVAGKAKLTRLKSEDTAVFKVTNNTIQNGREIVQYHKLRAFGNAARVYVAGWLCINTSALLRPLITR